MPPLTPPYLPPLGPPPPLPPPLVMCEADSQKFASAPSVPRGFKLQNFRPAFSGDHRGTLGGGGVRPNAPPPSPLQTPSPPSNTSMGRGPLHAPMASRLRWTMLRGLLLVWQVFLVLDSLMFGPMNATTVRIAHHLSQEDPETGKKVMRFSYTVASSVCVPRPLRAPGRESAFWGEVSASPGGT